MEITINIKGIEDTKRKDTKNIQSCYARVFDDGCKNWSKDAEYNLAYLKQVEAYATEILMSQGFIFLNDVYDLLGMRKSKAGQLVGWIYEVDNPIGDNFVSFRLYESCNHDFINGYSDTAILDFNVDGVIIDRL